MNRNNRNLESAPSAVLDLRTKAILLSHSSDADRRKEAREILESLIRRDAPGVEKTRRVLAEMYLADGAWSKALPHLRLATDPGSLNRYVRAMLGRSQLREAELGVARLEEIAPNQPATKLLRAEVLFRGGSYARAERMLDELTAVEAGETAATADLLAAARLLENFASQLSASGRQTTARGMLQQAESYLRRVAERGVDERMRLAAFLARNDRAGEAIEIVEEGVQDASAAAIAQGVGAFEDAGGFDEQMLERLDAVLATALQQHRRDLALLDAKARLLVAAEQFDDAAALYREILKQDASNFGVKNNLAELLALQGKNLDEALKLIAEAIDGVGPQPALLDTRATVHLARGEFARAVEDMQTVVAELPKPNRFFHLARALHAAGRTASAREALEEARARGLTSDDLHPLERTACQELTATLNSSDS